MSRTGVRVAAVALAATAALCVTTVVGAAPAGTAEPTVIAAALGGSITEVTPCNGPSQVTGNPGFLKVERPGASNGTISVNVSYGGSLTPGVDYDALPDPIEIPAGDTQTLLAVQAETPGTVTLTVEPGTGYVVGDPATATVTFALAELPVFCTEAVVETIAVGEQPTSILVEAEFDSVPVADTSFQPEGEAPDGLTLNRDGSWSGAATTVGTFEITGRWCLVASLCVIEVPWRITVVEASDDAPAPVPPPASAVAGAADYTG